MICTHRTFPRKSNPHFILVRSKANLSETKHLTDIQNTLPTKIILSLMSAMRLLSAGFILSILRETAYIKLRTFSVRRKFQSLLPLLWSSLMLIRLTSITMKMCMVGERELLTESSPILFMQDTFKDSTDRKSPPKARKDTP